MPHPFIFSNRNKKPYIVKLNKSMDTTALVNTAILVLVM